MLQERVDQLQVGNDLRKYQAPTPSPYSVFWGSHHPTLLSPCRNRQLSALRGIPSPSLELYEGGASDCSCKAAPPIFKDKHHRLLELFSSSRLTSLFPLSFPCNVSLSQSLVTLDNFIRNHSFLSLERQCLFQKPGLGLNVEPV